MPTDGVLGQAALDLVGDIQAVAIVLGLVLLGNTALGRDTQGGTAANIAAVPAGFGVVSAMTVWMLMAIGIPMESPLNHGVWIPLLLVGEGMVIAYAARRDETSRCSSRVAGRGTAMNPVVVWDVDGVFNPDAPSAEHIEHRYQGPAPDAVATSVAGAGAEEVSGVVYLHPYHASWIAEVSAAGAEHAWATSWGELAPGWLADRLGYPPARHWPVIPVGRHGGVRFGHSVKWPTVRAWLGDRPAIWVDDQLAGKDVLWSEDRTEAGIPTLLVPITAPGGLARADIDTILGWLAGRADPGTAPSSGAPRRGRPGRVS